MTHIVYLMSDTGGGHRAACRAMQAALDKRYPGQYTGELVDMWKDYMPFPLNYMPELYPKWVNASPRTYAVQYWLNDRIFHIGTVDRAYQRQMFRHMIRFFAEHPADMYVCAHSVFVRPGMYALRRAGITKPFLTIITDYAWPVMIWYDPRADKTLVPTQPSYERGLRLGLPAERMVNTGPVVHPKFADLTLSKAEARAKLGWPTDTPMILLVGGGDGMGPLVEMVQAIDARPIQAEFAVIAGRNAQMKAALDSAQWRHNVRTYGFVDNIEVYMRAADLMVTKAGPATMVEAATVGLPMVISGAIPFQETPNVDYMVERGAGVFAPGPANVAAAVERILGNGGHDLHALAEGVRKLAEPEAIWKIAAEIHAAAPR